MPLQPTALPDLASEAHAANARCQRLVSSMEALAADLEASEQPNTATKIRKRIAWALNPEKRYA